MNPQDFSTVSPRFKVEEYFAGKTKGQGVFYDLFGDIKARFKVELEGIQEQDHFLLKETLRYDWGEVVNREYRFTVTGDNSYQVTAADLVGPGTVESYGNTLRWNYRLKQKISGSIWTLSFDDWMFLQEDGLVLNRAYARKFGITLGEVFMVVSK